MSLKKNQSFAVFPAKRGAEKSATLIAAMAHVKDFMTDAQKSLILLREGKTALDSGNLKGALDCFTQGIIFNPTVSLFNYRAICHKQLDMYNEAYFDYSYNIRLEPENGAHYCNRGLCLAKLKKFNLAVEDLNSAILYEPTAGNYFARACVFVDFGRFADAVKDFTAAVSDEAACSTEFKIKVKYRRALAHFDLKMYEASISDATEVLQLDATHVNARSLLGKAYKIIHEYQKAEEQLTNAILIESDQAHLYAERGDIRFRTGQQNKIIEAVYDFDVAVKLLDGRLGQGKEPGQPHHGSSGVGFANVNGSIASSRIASSTATATIMQGGKVKRIASSAAETDNRRRLNTGDDTTENGDDDENFWNELDEVSGNLKTDAEQAQPAGRGRSSHGHRPQSKSNNSSQAMQPSQRREIEEQLAETLYKRAQAKMMLPVHEDSIIESALVDAWRAIKYINDDDDFHLMAATCLIRLHRYDEAVKILEYILMRSPQNMKAMYNLSFCRRAEGYQKDAIQGLTKIINSTQDSNGSNALDVFANMDNLQQQPTKPKSFPIHRVLEMRGTLFHEIQAHKLALHDFGKAIAINPANAENYYLRGDCHMKLGDYELALQDYDQAEFKGFSDRCSLLLSRGNVRRLLKDNAGALQDYLEALEILKKTNDKISQIRAQSFIAFCYIDLGSFNEAYDMLSEAHEFNAAMVRTCEADITKHRSNPETLSPPDVTVEEVKALDDLQSELFYSRRVDWILQYHMILCKYMTRDYHQARAIADICISEAYQRYIPDNYTEGILFFFYGQILMVQRDYTLALEYFQACLNTRWIRVQRQEFLCLLAIAKAFQCLSRHTEALQFFNKAHDLDNQNPYLFFRRGWTHKALGNFVGAGDDFETAKHISANDPNFAIDYKRIAKYEYMEIADEPDLVEPFPPLLPVPGLDVK